MSLKFAHKELLFHTTKIVGCARSLPPLNIRLSLKTDDCTSGRFSARSGLKSSQFLVGLVVARSLLLSVFPGFAALSLRQSLRATRKINTFARFGNSDVKLYKHTRCQRANLGCHGNFQIFKFSFFVSPFFMNPRIPCVRVISALHFKFY